ncbi:hypothetical protein BUE65_21820 [Klebsiella variicola]|nr:hypothetical protein BUE65_21820 [Klebsiella variicola]
MVLLKLLQLKLLLKNLLTNLLVRLKLTTIHLDIVLRIKVQLQLNLVHLLISHNLVIKNYHLVRRLKYLQTKFQVDGL